VLINGEHSTEEKTMIANTIKAAGLIAVVVVAHSDSEHTDADQHASANSDNDIDSAVKGLDL
jgi:hypothetical protein